MSAAESAAIVLWSRLDRLDARAPFCSGIVLSRHRMFLRGGRKRRTVSRPSAYQRWIRVVRR